MSDTDTTEERSDWLGRATIEGNEVVVRWTITPRMVADAFVQHMADDADDDADVIAAANEMGRSGLYETLGSTLAGAPLFMEDNPSDMVGASTLDFMRLVVEEVLEHGSYTDEDAPDDRTAAEGWWDANEDAVREEMAIGERDERGHRRDD